MNDSSSTRRCPLIGLTLAALAGSIGCDPPDETRAPAPVDSGLLDEAAPDAAPGDAAEGDAEPDPCRIAPPPPVDPELARALDDALAAGLDDVGAPGIAAAVILADGRGWIGAVGRDDIRDPAPLRPWSRFRIASVTKTFVSAAVMLRVEAGRWTLDDPIDDWVPGFDLGPDITLERLLNHTAGVYNYSDDVSFILRRTEHLEPAEVVEFALTHDAELDPGEAYLYSNTGFFLLGMALEALEDRPLASILRGDLLAPLDLSHTWLEQFEPAPGGCGIGQGHVTFDPGLTEGFDAGWSWAAGGLAAPPTDLCRWVAALGQGEVVTPATLDRMATATAQSIAAGEPYGLGLFVADRAGRAVIGHTGSTMGFRGDVFFEPASGACVAIETNDFTARPIPLAEAIWSRLPR